jgi:hypothetical protein
MFGYAILQNEQTRAVTQAAVDQRYQLITGFGEERTALPHVQVYPNPATDRIFVRSDQAYSDALITVTDMLGKTVTSIACPTIDCDLDVRKLGPGLYFVHWHKDQTVLTYPLIKQHYE